MISLSFSPRPSASVDFDVTLVEDFDTTDVDASLHPRSARGQAPHTVEQCHMARTRRTRNAKRAWINMHSLSRIERACLQWNRKDGPRSMFASGEWVCPMSQSNEGIFPTTQRPMTTQHLRTCRIIVSQEVRTDGTYVPSDFSVLYSYTT